MVRKFGGGPSSFGSHGMAEAMGCEVRYYLSSHKKYQPVGGFRNKYLDIGTILHSALMYYYAERMERKPQWYVDFPDMMEVLEEDSKGRPAELRNALQFLDFYKVRAAGDAWTPLFIEETFEAKVWQLKGLKGPATAEDDVFVTCRPDLICKINGENWIVDHKSAGAGRNTGGRLSVINEQYPDHTYDWQAMVNLHLVRTQMDIAGFIFNRVKRDAPYDRDPYFFQVPTRMYPKMPSVMAAAAARRIELNKKIANNEPMIPHPWECEAKWRCPYTRICYSESVEQRNMRINMEFTIED